jgi:predicted acyltransferase
MGTAARARPERIAALDAFRGITIAGMLLVNNPGTWDAIYPPLEHAPWHGWTPTDLIFPFFVFVVGITTHLSLVARAGRGDSDRALTLRILRRGGLIVLFGLLLQAFPYVPVDRITQLRFPGVLQRIGVCYVAAALLSRRRDNRAVAIITAILLLGYWALQALVAPPGVATPTLDVPQDTLSAWIDRTVFGEHLWRQSHTWDPEGLLSTLPAIGTCLLGVLAGRWLATSRALPERLNGLFAAGAIGAMTGLVWNWVFPINKNLWTSSYVLFTAGLACLTLATCAWLIDARGRGRWAAPAVTYGKNPMVAFIGSGVMARLLGMLHLTMGGESVTLQQAIYRGGFASWLAPRNASLGFAIGFVALWYGILRLLERRGVILKV